MDQSGAVRLIGRRVGGLHVEGGRRWPMPAEMCQPAGRLLQIGDVALFDPPQHGCRLRGLFEPLQPPSQINAVTGPGREMTQGLVVGPNGQIHDETIVILVPREPLLEGARPFVIFQPPDESGARLTEEVDRGEGSDELGDSGGVWMVDQTGRRSVGPSASEEATVARAFSVSRGPTWGGQGEMALRFGVWGRG